jgi:hypothetical protein
MLFQWYYILGALVVGLLVGAAIAKRFGTDWLAILAWAVGDGELEAFARIAWEAGIVPELWRKTRFHDNVDEFAKWVIEQAHKLNPDKVIAMTHAANKNGVQRRVKNQE